VATNSSYSASLLADKCTDFSTVHTSFSDRHLAKMINGCKSFYRGNAAFSIIGYHVAPDPLGPIGAI
jgi:hypothetical protein